MGTNGKFFLINAHGVLRRMGAVTEIPGMDGNIFNSGTKYLSGVCMMIAILRVTVSNEWLLLCICIL